MSTIKLRYLVDPGNRPLDAAAKARVGSIGLFYGELDQLGMTLQSDVVSENGLQIERAITLYHDDTLFPTDDEKIAATRDLYSATLSQGFPGAVKALEPEVTP